MSDVDVIQEIRENIIEMKGMLENITMKSDLQLKAIEEKVKSNHEKTEEKLKVANNRIKDLESNQKWFVCAILVEFIALIFKNFIK